MLSKSVRKRQVRRSHHQAIITEALEGRALFAGTPIDNGGMNQPGGGHGTGDYQIGDRWFSTASGSTGSTGTPITLTWGFVADGLTIGGYNGEPTSGSVLQARLTALYGSMTAAKAVFQKIFDSWSAVTGITYLYEANDDGASFSNAAGVLGVRADLRISSHPIDGASNVLAYNFFPNGGGGDMVIDANDLSGGGYMTNLSNNSLRLRNVLAHEHGHGLGLDHVIPVNQTKLMEPFVSTLFDGPQYDDILAIQTLYGDSYEKNGRNQTGATAYNLGSFGNGTNIPMVTNASTSPGDDDYYKFTLGASQFVTLTASPVGTTYQQGPQDTGVSSPFNGAQQSDLTLNIYAANGTTLLGSVNATGLGASETLTGLSLAPGTYVVRVATTGSGSTQMYKLTANISSQNPPTVPSTPDLDAASDTGISNSDDITNDTTPTFTGTGQAGSTITLFANGTSVGTGVVAGNGTWSVTSSVLAQGTYNFTANASSVNGTSAESSGLSVTIDTVGLGTPTASYARETAQVMTITFADATQAAMLSADEVLITRTSDASAALATPELIPVGSLTRDGAVVTITPAGLLPDGNFTLSLTPTAVTDVAGNGATTPLALKFFQLGGDATGNSAVNFGDLVIVAQNYGSSGKGFSSGNFNYDPEGKVDFADLVILAQHYGNTLPQPIQTPPANLAAVITAPVTVGGGKKNRTATDVLA